MSSTKSTPVNAVKGNTNQTRTGSEISDDSLTIEPLLLSLSVPNGAGSGSGDDLLNGQNTQLQADQPPDSSQQDTSSEIIPGQSSNGVNAQPIVPQPGNLPIIHPEDSASNISRGKRSQTSQSSTAALKLLNKKKEIELKMDLAALQESNYIEEERLRIKRQSEEESNRLQRKQQEILLRSKLQAAQEVTQMLEYHTSENSEVQFKRQPGVQTAVKPIVETYVNSLPDITSNISPAPVAIETQPIYNVNSDPINNNQVFSVTGTSKTPNVNCDPVNNIHVSPVDRISKTHSVNSETNDLLSVFNKLLMDQNLPTQDIEPFDGTKVLEYQTFIKNFEFVVERNTSDPARRLEFLLKYTKGDAKQLIRYCPLIEPPEDAYERARYLLKRDYGDPSLIAASLKLESEKFERIVSGDKKGLRKFSLFLINCVNSKTNNREMDCMDSFDFIIKLCEKLPKPMQQQWISQVGKIKDRHFRGPTLNDFEEFVGRLSRNENDPRISGLGYQKPSTSATSSQSNQAPNHTNFRKNYKPHSSRTLSTQVMENLAGKSPCLSCGPNTYHKLYECRKFKAMNSKEKSDIIKSKGLCFACLNPGHMKQNCKNREWSKCEKCDRQHHTILHDPNKDVNSDNSTGTIPKISSGCAVTCNSNRTDIISEGEPLMSVSPVKVRSKSSGLAVTTYAFIDHGSSSGFLTPELQNVLRIRCKGVNMILKTLNQEKSVKTEQTIDDLEISDLNGNDYLTLPASYIQNVMPVTVTDAPTQDDLNNFEHFKGIKIPSVSEIDIPRVTIMIGINVPSVTTPLNIATGDIGQPYGIKCPIGWLFYGFKGKLNNVVNRVNFIQTSDNLDNQIKYYFNLEFSERLSDSGTGLSREDKQFLNIMDNSIALKNGHYETKLPFRDPNEVVPNNRLQAELYANRLRKRLDANAELLQQYKDFMDNLIERNYCEKVPIFDINKSDGRVWFIPHHPVTHPKKPNKVRVVFNCPLNFNGISLNNLLLCGPHNLNLLLGVLLRWRQDYIAVMADIESMFYQVRVDKRDIDMLRFLWWPQGDLDNPITEYRMLVHLFGAVSSPSCSNYALRKVAVDFESEYRPEVINCINNDFYVDDLLKSLSSVDEGVKLVKELCEVLSKAGFNLTKWISNSKELLQTIPENKRIEEVRNLDLDNNSLPVKRALGVEWSVETDTIEFNVNINDLNLKATKRNILSIMSSVFDPFGIAAPFILKAKIILQNLCKLKVSWDETIPIEHKIQWDKWTCDLQNLGTIKVNRCMKPENFGTVINTQIHHFADASQLGYGSVSYIRFENEEGLVYLSFLIGRSRVAPIKPMTIVKLELSAATMVVRMNNLLLKELSIPVDDSFYWTDSQTVIKYIRNETARHQIFVSNRLAIINDGSNVNQWRYVPTAQNPADHASRGLSVQELDNGNWLRAPEFLSRPSDSWPVTPVFNESRVEVNINSVKISDESKNVVNELINYYSDWKSLKRGIAWWIRLKNILKLKSRKLPINNDLCNRSLTPEEVVNAENAIVKFVQKSEFSDEFDSCLKGSSVKLKSDISNLDPIIKNNVLCVGGRLRNAIIPEDAKHQVILPKNSHVSNLIVRDVHQKVGHQGRNHTLAELRQKYWIIKSGVLIKNIISKCVICRKLNAHVGQQKMADLPQCRVKSDQGAFSCVGIDYFGHFEIKVGRSIKKRYGVIFTCFSTRAVHIEVADSLDTSSCVSAIRRFIARRGVPMEFYSDNGTNLVSASKELKCGLEELDQSVFNNLAVKFNFKWNFNPPAASHHGGAWERQIRTIRKVLQSILCEQFVKTSETQEQLHTFLCEVEFIINSRPLTRVSEDPSDLNVITPNSLLLLNPLPSFPPGTFNEKDIYSKRRWRQIQYLAQLFWYRWTREYLPMLQQRQKWLRPNRNVQTGDVVLVVDENAPRCSWPLGLVIETFPNKSGLVRSVKLRTQCGTLVRPIDKLCLLLEQDE